jgi:hypothetical protein
MRAYIFRGIIATQQLRTPYYMSKVPLPSHKFMQPPRWYDWLQKMINNGVMLPFNGITFPRKILNISKVVPDLTWMDTRPYSAYMAFVSQENPFLSRKCTNEYKWNDFKYRQGEITLDSRSANRMFLLQLCYGVGCPGAGTSISSVKRQACIVQGTCIPWYEEVFVRWCCVYTCIFTSSD